VQGNGEAKQFRFKSGSTRRFTCPIKGGAPLFSPSTSEYSASIFSSANKARYKFRMAEEDARAISRSEQSFLKNYLATLSRLSLIYIYYSYNARSASARQLADRLLRLLQPESLQPVAIADRRSFNVTVTDQGATIFARVTASSLRDITLKKPYMINRPLLRLDTGDPADYRAAMRVFSLIAPLSPCLSRISFSFSLFGRSLFHVHVRDPPLKPSIQMHACVTKEVSESLRILSSILTCNINRLRDATAGAWKLGAVPMRSSVSILGKLDGARLAKLIQYFSTIR